MKGHGVHAWRSASTSLTAFVAGVAVVGLASAQDVAGIKARPADLAAVGVTATGDGTTVAIIEVGGGFDFDHPAFDSAALQQNFTGISPFPSTSHAAGVASVVYANGGGYAGVAPGIDHFSLGAVNSAESIAKAITALPDAADIVNLSLGFGTDDTDGMSKLTLFLDWWATQNDAVVVKSAGNSGTGGLGNQGSTTITVPGDGYNMITVGATNAANTAVAPFSSEGRTDDLRNKPDIVAPGSNITVANQWFRDNDTLNGDLADNDNNGIIGLDTTTFADLVKKGVVFATDAAGTNPVGSLNVKDRNNDGVFNINDVDNDGNLSAGDIIYLETGVAAAFDPGDDTDPDTVTTQGTSFAAPHVAGAAALIRDFARKSPTHSDDHRVVKAILLNAANHEITDKNGGAWNPSIPGTDSLDDELGTGLLDVQNAFRNFMPDETTNPAVTKPVAWDFNTVTGSTEIIYDIDEDLLGGTTLAATIVWDRLVSRVAAGDPDTILDDSFAVDAFANLDLELLLDGNPVTALDALGRSPFSRSPVDPTEHIYFQLAQSGDYALRVFNKSGFSADFGFALFSTPVPEPAVLFALAAMGVVTLARRRRA